MQSRSKVATQRLRVRFKPRYRLVCMAKILQLLQTVTYVHQITLRNRTLATVIHSDCDGGTNAVCSVTSMHRIDKRITDSRKAAETMLSTVRCGPRFCKKKRTNALDRKCGIKRIVTKTAEFCTSD